jgi:protein SCO1/2
MKWLAGFAVIAAISAQAQPLALPPAPAAVLEQRLGARPTLDVPAIDESGNATRVSSFLDGQRPVLLVPGYYRCPQLCGLVMHGLLDALQQSAVPQARWRVVGFSIDPNDTAADARKRRDAFADSAGSADLHLLVLSPADAKQLATQVGYSYEQTHGAGFAHPASVVLLTPGGAVSRYFNGVAFDPQEMRVALADAAGDRIGGVTARLALLCAHFDPHVGKHTAAIMDAIRAASLLLLAGLAAWAWRRR